MACSGTGCRVQEFCDHRLVWTCAGRLSFPPLRVLLPRWSPDGKQIAFNAIRPDAGATWKAYVVSSEGGNPQPILPSEQSQMDVNWSPDGNSLVFDALFAEGSKEPIYTIDLRSNAVSALPGSGDFFSPRWSPDGRCIAAMTKTLPFNE